MLCRQFLPRACGYHIHGMAVAVVVLAVVGFGAQNLNAAESDHVASDSTQTMTLAQALDRALRLHPSSRLSDTAEQAARLQREAADRWLGGTPTVSSRYNFDDLTDDVGEEEWEVILNLPLTPGAERQARQALAQQQKLAADEARVHRQWQVAGQLRARMWEAHRARLELSLSREIAAVALEQFQQMQRLVAADSNPRTDLLLAESVKLAAENRVIDAQAEYDHAQRRWQLLTGVSQLPAAAPEVTVTGDHEVLIQQHPKTRWLTAKLDQARASEQVQRKLWTTKPVFGLGYRGQRPNSLEPEINSVGIYFEMPLDFGGYNRSGEAVAVQQRGTAEWELVIEERKLEVTLHDAELALDSEQRALTVAVARARVANEAERLALLAFEQGEHTFLDLLQTRERAQAARGDQLRRELALAEAAAFFNQAAGVIPQ